MRFFDHSDCYTVHGSDDCELVAKVVYKSTAYIGALIPDDKKETLQFVSLSKNNFELAVRELLLVRNLRVEVFVKQSTDWKLEYRGSPGNLLQFEDILFANKEVLVGNSIISLLVKLEGGAQRRVGVASVEQNDCQFQLLEFLDDDFFTELEATVVLLGPKECLLPSLDGEYAAVKTLLERNGVMITVPKKSSANDLIQDLNRLLRFAKGQQEDATGLKELQLQLASDALKVAIKYLDLVNDPGNLGHYEMKQLDLKRYDLNNRNIGFNVKCIFILALFIWTPLPWLH